jgi:hypothetical protein
VPPALSESAVCSNRHPSGIVTVMLGAIACCSVWAISTGVMLGLRV